MRSEIERSENGVCCENEEERTVKEKRSESGEQKRR